MHHAKMFSLSLLKNIKWEVAKEVWTIPNVQKHFILQHAVLRSNDLSKSEKHRYIYNASETALIDVRVLTHISTQLIFWCKRFFSSLDSFQGAGVL